MLIKLSIFYLHKIIIFTNIIRKVQNAILFIWITMKILGFSQTVLKYCDDIFIDER